MPYPDCQWNRENSGPFVFIHFDELVFTFSTTSAIVFVRSGQAKEEVDMIADPADLKRRTIDFAQHTGEVRMDFRGDDAREQRLPVFRAKDEMSQDAGQ